MFLTPTLQATVRRIQTPLILIATPFFAVLAGLIAGSGKIDPLLLLALPVAFIGILIWQHGGNQYNVGILAVMLSGGLINFFAIPTGTESRIVVSFLVAAGLLALWLLDLAIVRRKLALTPSLVNKPILAFAAASTVAFVWSIIFRDPLVWTPGSFIIVQTASLVVNLTLLFLVVLVAEKVKEIRWLKMLTLAMLGMGILSIILYQLNSPLQYYILNTGGRGMFSAWVALLAYALALFDNRLDKRLRLLLLLLVGLLVFRYFFMGQSWVSGWLPLGVGCAVLTLLRSRKLFLVMMLLGTLYLAYNFDEYYTAIVLGEEAEGSGTGRIELWEMNLNHVRNHLLFGMGPAGYAVYNMSYHPEDARSTHNNYFDVLAQTGIVGSVAFLWLLSAFVRTCWQARRLLHGQRDFAEAFANATFAGCFSMMVAMMLGDWILPFAYNQTITGFDNANYSWIFMGGAVALWHITRNQATNQAGDTKAFILKRKPVDILSA